MVAKKATSKAGPSAAGNKTIANDPNANIPAESRPGVSKTALPTRSANEGSSKVGPPSSLKTKSPSLDGRVIPASKGQNHSVQCHTEDDGLFVVEPIFAETGDEAALKARKKLGEEGFRKFSIRGVTPYSDPDANSLGGERDAGIMYANAENGGNIINTVGTDANREATEKLGKADVSELGD